MPDLDSNDEKIVLFNRDKIMNDLMKNVRIVEVYSDVAGHKKGASLGIDALRASSKEMNADYYEKLQLDIVSSK
jgi:arginase